MLKSVAPLFAPLAFLVGVGQMAMLVEARRMERTKKIRKLDDHTYLCLMRQDGFHDTWIKFKVGALQIPGLQHIPVDASVSASRDPVHNAKKKKLEDADFNWGLFLENDDIPGWKNLQPGEDGKIKNLPDNTLHEFYWNLLQKVKNVRIRFLFNVPGRKKLLCTRYERGARRKAIASLLDSKKLKSSVLFSTHEKTFRASDAQSIPFLEELLKMAPEVALLADQQKIEKRIGG